MLPALYWSNVSLQESRSDRRSGKPTEAPCGPDRDDPSPNKTGSADVTEVKLSELKKVQNFYYHPLPEEKKKIVMFFCLIFSKISAEPLQ